MAVVETSGRLSVKSSVCHYEKERPERKVLAFCLNTLIGPEAVVVEQTA